MDSHDNQFGMDGTGFWETIPALQNNIFSGGSSEGTMSKGGRRKGSKDGSNRDDDGGIGHYNALTEEETIYLTDLFFNKLKASGGIHYLYNHMKQDGGTVSWRKVVAFHKSFIVNQKSRPAKKQTKSLAVMPKKTDLVPMRHIGCDFIIMQADQGLAESRDMKDRNHTSILNIVDYATRMSFPFALKKNEDQAEAGRAIRQFVRLVRKMYYNDDDSADWPSPDMIVTIDNFFEN